MSYARIGGGSDVYVWADRRHINMIVRQDLPCPNMPVGVLHPLAGKTWGAGLRSEAFRLLAEWESLGVVVPTDVFDRLSVEIQELGDKVES